MKEQGTTIATKNPNNKVCLIKVIAMNNQPAQNDMPENEVSGLMLAIPVHYAVLV